MFCVYSWKQMLLWGVSGSLLHTVWASYTLESLPGGYGLESGVETVILHISVAPIRKGCSGIPPVNSKRLTTRKILLTVVMPVFNLLFILEKFPATRVSLELFQFCPPLRLTSASVHLFKCPPTLTWPFLFCLLLNKVIDVDMPEINISKPFCIFYEVLQR